MNDPDDDPTEPRIALSIKQPWATLIVHGVKCVELRRWSSSRVGWIFIHTGQQSDRSAFAWDLVPKGLMDFAGQTGGIIGKARLAGCRPYRSAKEFASDAHLHQAPPEYYRPPMYGFLFVEPKVVPFEPRHGNLYFFEV